jgi:hypothetical protein
VIRFVLYGLFGWCAEVMWTALYHLVGGSARASGDTAERQPLTRAERLRLEGKTYLWMFPIYGGALLAFERVHGAIAPWAWPARGAVYMMGAFAVEAASGLLLRAATGRVPWDYSYARASALGGAIRLDYAPLWFAFGLMLERVQALVTRMAAALS